MIIDSFERVFQHLAEKLLQEQAFLQQFRLRLSPQVPPRLLRGLSADPSEGNCCKNRHFCNSSDVLNDPMRRPGANKAVFAPCTPSQARDPGRLIG